jgi:hypothetical protein
MLPLQREVHTGSALRILWDARVCASSNERSLVVSPHYWIVFSRSNDADRVEDHELYRALMPNESTRTMRNKKFANR